MPTFALCYGSIFDSPCEAYVNPVNTQGVCGAGLALEFKRRFPSAVDAYVHYCTGLVLVPLKVGRVLFTKTGSAQPAYVLHFATKDRWRKPSQMIYIWEGLNDLKAKLEHSPIRSVAIPAIGCGLGGLDWRLVEGAVRDVLGTLPPGYHFELYPPQVIQ